MTVMKSIFVGAVATAFTVTAAGAMTFDHGHGKDDHHKKKKVVQEMMTQCDGKEMVEEKIIKGEDGKEHKAKMIKCLVELKEGDMGKGKHKMMFIKKDGAVTELDGDMSEEEIQKMLKEKGIEWTPKDGDKKMKVMRMKKGDMKHKEMMHEKMEHGDDHDHEKMHQMHVKVMAAESDCKGEMTKEVTVTIDDEGNEVTKTVSTCTVKKK